MTMVSGKNVRPRRASRLNISRTLLQEMASVVGNVGNGSTASLESYLEHYKNIYGEVALQELVRDAQHAVNKRDKQQLAKIVSAAVTSRATQKKPSFGKIAPPHSEQKKPAIDFSQPSYPAYSAPVQTPSVPVGVSEVHADAAEMNAFLAGLVPVAPRNQSTFGEVIKAADAMERRIEILVNTGEISYDSAESLRQEINTFPLGVYALAKSDELQAVVSRASRFTERDFHEVFHNFSSLDVNNEIGRQSHNVVAFDEMAVLFSQIDVHLDQLVAAQKINVGQAVEIEEKFAHMPAQLVIHLRESGAELLHLIPETATQEDVERVVSEILDIDVEKIALLESPSDLAPVIDIRNAVHEPLYRDIHAVVSSVEDRLREMVEVGEIEAEVAVVLIAKLQSGEVSQFAQLGKEDIEQLLEDVSSYTREDIEVFVDKILEFDVVERESFGSEAGFVSFGEISELFEKVRGHLDQAVETDIVEPERAQHAVEVLDAAPVQATPKLIDVGNDIVDTALIEQNTPRLENAIDVINQTDLEVVAVAEERVFDEAGFILVGDEPRVPQLGEDGESPAVNSIVTSTEPISFSGDFSTTPPTFGDDFTVPTARDFDVPSFAPAVDHNEGFSRSELTQDFHRAETAAPDDFVPPTTTFTQPAPAAQTFTAPTTTTFVPPVQHAPDSLTPPAVQQTFTTPVVDTPTFDAPTFAAPSNDAPTFAAPSNNARVEDNFQQIGAANALGVEFEAPTVSTPAPVRGDERFVPPLGIADDPSPIVLDPQNVAAQRNLGAMVNQMRATGRSADFVVLTELGVQGRTAEEAAEKNKLLQEDTAKKFGLAGDLKVERTGLNNTFGVNDVPVSLTAKADRGENGGPEAIVPIYSNKAGGCMYNGGPCTNCGNCLAGNAARSIADAAGPQMGRVAGY